MPVLPYHWSAAQFWHCIRRPPVSVRPAPSDKTPVLCCRTDGYPDIKLLRLPNIAPEAEYLHRLAELQRLITQLPLEHPVSIVSGEYVPQRFFELAKGLEQEPERGLRCQKCIAHRLEATIQQAKLQQADYVTTTLSISPHKDALFINTTGAKLAETYGVSWLYADFKKKGGYLQSIALSKEYQLYRQDFCGCVYSRMQREAEKQNTTGTASKET